MKRKLWDNAPLFLVVATGAVLRVWNYPNIPFTYDEYSGLWRLGNGDFHTLITEGIMRDAHPPFYMLFLNYWTSLVGMTAAWVKLPFVLSGIWSVYLCYLVGRTWVSHEAGILSAAAFAVMQEGVMHSQIARPYAFGAMFLLLSAWLLYRVVYNPGRWSALALGLTLAACAYTHHFSMLAAAWLWLGVAIGYRQARKPLFISALTAVVLYLPNVYIVKAQLAMGGIGTVVAPPDAAFFSSYASYLFHFSWWFGGAIAAIALFAWIADFRLRSPILYTWLAVVAGTVATGTIYSLAVAPVLQPRVLYFVIPFLLLILFHAADVYRKFTLPVLTIVILTTGTITLVKGREYYSQFYNDGFKGVLATSLQSGLPSTTTRMLAYSPQILEKQRAQFPDHPETIVNPDSLWTWCDYKTFVDTAGSDAFHFGWTTQYYRPSVEFLGMVYSKYNHIRDQHNYFNACLYELEKSGSPHNRMVCYPQTASDTCKYFASDMEYGLSWSTALNKVITKPYDLMAASLEFSIRDTTGDAMLVVEVRRNGEPYAWSGQHIEDFVCAGDSIVTAWTGFYSPDLIKDYSGQFDLKVYIWNRGLTFDVHRMHLTAIPGNPYTYSLLEDFAPLLDPLPN
ncbi:MAG: glycosyltransferase family 39 protein [Flavobacteriales bacterium]|nr:glycosyltransferase family 39 protein [Flavobacteriales bacterium]